MEVKVTKTTKITLTPQEVQEAISEYLKSKIPNNVHIIKGDIKFKVDVHEIGDDKMKGVELVIIEKSK